MSTNDAAKPTIAPCWNTIARAQACIQQANLSKETRFVSRAVRFLSLLRKQISNNTSTCKEMIEFYIPDSIANKSYLLSLFANKSVDVEMGDKAEAEQLRPAKPQTVTYEVYVFVHLLCVLHLIDLNRNIEALQCCEKLLLRSGSDLASSSDVVFDPLVASCYFYFALVLKKVQGNLKAVKQLFFKILSITTVRRMEETKVTILNVLLRNFLDQNQYDEAENLICRTETTIKEDFVTSGQMARFAYFDGVVKLFTLQYGKAHDSFQRALRKVPSTKPLTKVDDKTPDSSVSVSPTSFVKCFRRECVIRIALSLLLQGEIPQRSLFTEDSFAIAPYLKLVLAIRCGDLTKFSQVQSTFASVFEKDNMAMLVQRLRQTVIISGLKKLTQSYSRISFKHIGMFLLIENIKDIEFIVAKAISDGVIEGIIFHNEKDFEQGYLETPSTTSDYNTMKPVDELNKRIRACYRLRNNAMKAMRYSANSTKPVGTEDIIQLTFGTDDFEDDFGGGDD